MRTALLPGLLLAAALCGCQATRYQPSTDSGGFAELELVDGIWRIRFMGNAYTTQETAQTYWLYRAAELTIAKGYDGFEVLPQIGLVRAHGNPQSRGSALLIEGEIRMLKAPFEFLPPRTFDAGALKAALDPHVNGAKCETLTTSGNVCPHPHDYLFAQSGSTPVSKAETPPPGSDGVRPKAADSSAQPAPGGPTTKPKPAPALARPQAPPVAGTRPSPKPTGPCEIKPVMSDQDLINCGARTPR